MITDGFGNEISNLEWLNENLTNYVTFDEGASMVAPHWTRHFLHSEIKKGKLYLHQLLIVCDDELFGTGFGTGRKFFISINEINRLREEYAGTRKRNHTRCGWCFRPEFRCLNKPCLDRKRTTPEYRRTVEEMQEFVASWVERDKKPVLPRKFGSARYY